MVMGMNLENIAQYILQKLGDRLYNKVYNREYGGLYIITTDGKLYGLSEYEDLIKENLSTPSAYIFVANLWFSYEPSVYLPFIGESDLLIEFYLRKYYRPCETHFKDLKYIAIIVHFLDTNEAFMEVVDLDVTANNTNLPKLVQILSENADDEDKYEKERELEEAFNEQRLFGGYDFCEVAKILKKYYKENDKSLADIIKAISDDYNRIFQPYRITLSPNKEGG